ncbi:helix-turn-helix domain-containing protein [Senegalia massiliensis]|uniref:helix-turn-helix domain-containing protein n=1 Tax=Senegalia massiliensis TaxID=1720316 RepID=UPI0013623E26|nr:helix-turn-helix transcriptional regulator [Senegalia massiliensis]
MDFVRERLIETVKSKGIKYDFIAKQIGVGRSMLSQFKNGKKDLSEEKLNRLIDYLWD